MRMNYLDAQAAAAAAMRGNHDDTTVAFDVVCSQHRKTSATNNQIRLYVQTAVPTMPTMSGALIHGQRV